MLVDGCTWELLSEIGCFEGLEEVRQLVESTRNLRLPLLDELLSHLTRIKVVRLAARLASELAYIATRALTRFARGTTKDRPSPVLRISTSAGVVCSSPLKYARCCRSRPQDLSARDPAAPAQIQSPQWAQVD